MTLGLSYQSKNFIPQALASGFTSRVAKDESNPLLVHTAPQGRQAKRHAQQINYAEYDNFDDFEDDRTPSRLALAATVGASNLTATQQASYTQKMFLKAARRSRHPIDIDNETKVQALVKNPIQKPLLVPIRLDIEYNNGTLKLVDFFMWNLYETLMTPLQFAILLSGDLELPLSVQSEITELITKQLEDYSFASSLQLPTGRDYNVVIELQVNLDKKLYQDKFEWDLAQTEITPEDFAQIVVSDTGLSPEFMPAIAHGLHEVTLRMKKEIIEGVYNFELHRHQQKSGIIFQNGVRILTEASLHNGNDGWEPVVEVLTPWEIEKREIERERNIRRLKRENIRRDYDDFSGSKRRAGPGRRRHDELDMLR